MKKNLSSHFEKNDSKLKTILIYLILIVFVIISVYPLLNVFSVSLRSNDSLFLTDLKIIPDNWSLDNYRKALFEKDLLIWIRNSLAVSTMTAITGLTLSASAGYAFSRFNFYGKKTSMMLFLVTQMFPAPMLLLPMFIMITKLHLINNFFGLLIPYTATAVPFTVWLMKGYFDTIPKSLEESAYIDGCNSFTAFYKVILPLATPALAISALFAFMSAWSEYIVAQIILRKPDLITLPVGLVQLQMDFTAEWGVYSAAAIITTIPVVILFVSLSKYLVGGLTLGGVKG
ncbi:sugar ABC transporter permease [Helicovermis profundi]|uniref:ABC transporter permease subunit n=1 Tax=Helicovermis profundi TaxID=3065157 RepID=A0AAU9E0Q7_9FIRM|nr:ABC transporter permease subunit [Clostridia bacterium S502]